LGFFPKHLSQNSGFAMVSSQMDISHSSDKVNFQPHQVFWPRSLHRARNAGMSKSLEDITGGLMEWNPPFVHLDVFNANTSPMVGSRCHVFARHSSIWLTSGLPRAPAADESSGPNAVSKCSCKDNWASEVDLIAASSALAAIIDLSTCVSSRPNEASKATDPDNGASLTFSPPKEPSASYDWLALVFQLTGSSQVCVSRPARLRFDPAHV